MPGKEALSRESSPHCCFFVWCCFPQHHGFWVSHRDQQGGFLLPTLSHHLFSWWLRHLNIWSHRKLLYATVLYNYETVPKLNLFLNLKWVDGDLPFTQIISRKRILRIRIHDAQNFSKNAVRNPSLSVDFLSFFSPTQTALIEASLSSYLHYAF